MNLTQTWIDFAPGKSAAAATRIKSLLAEADFDASLTVQCEIGMVNAILVLTAGGVTPLLSLIEADPEIAATIRCSGAADFALDATDFRALQAHFATHKYALLAPAEFDTEGLVAFPLTQPPEGMLTGMTMIPVQDPDQAVAIAISQPAKPGQPAPSLVKAV